MTIKPSFETDKSKKGLFSKVSDREVNDVERSDELEL
jgi:hypothetical protein